MEEPTGGRKNTRARLAAMPEWMDKSSKDLRDCIASLQDANSTMRERLEAMNSAITSFQKNTPAPAPKEKIKPVKVIDQYSSPDLKRPPLDTMGIATEEFVETMRTYIVHETRTMRTACLRLIRCVLDREGMIRALVDMGMYLFICRSFERDKSGGWERLEALKLLRATCVISPSLLTPYVINSIAAVAKDKKDPFSRTAMDSLIEMTIHNPAVVAVSHNLHILFDSALDFPFTVEKKGEDFSERRQNALLGAILYILNAEETRKHVHLRTHLPILFAPITDAVHAECTADLLPGVYWSCRALVTLMRSWSGFFVLASEGFLVYFVSALTLPSIDIKEYVLDSLFEILHEKVPAREDPFSVMTTSKSGGRDLVLPGTDGRIEIPPRFVRHNLIDNFLAAQIQALIEAGLAGGLVELESQMRKLAAVTGSDSRENMVSIKATILLGSVLALSNTLLPSQQCARLQTLEELVKRSLRFHGDPQIRSRASTMVTNLHMFSQKNKGQDTSVLTDIGPNRYKRVRGQDRRLDRLDDVKKKIDWRMDVVEFRQKLQLSGVLQTKEWGRWDWNVIEEIVDGPLENPALLQAAVRTKFVKRLVSFLRPSNNAFANISRKSQNSKYTQIACQLLEILVADDDGRAFLNSNQLLTQIGELLRLEAEPSYSSTCKYERLFSKERVLRTLAQDYFTIIGALSGSKAGLELLLKSRIFEHLPTLCLLPDRHDLCTIIMTCVDYNLSSSPARIVLQKALTSDNALVRFRATRHLQALYRSSVYAFHDWGIKFTLKQLNDDDQRVAKLAMDILDEASDDVDCLESMISRNPQLKGKVGKELMMRFLSRRTGFQHLSSSSFITDELDYWRKVGYLEYCINSEQQLMDSITAMDHPPVHPHTHFFGVLASTQQGCDFLDESQSFLEFCGCLRDETRPSLHRRAALWTIGSIGRSATGLKYILKNDSEIVNYICDLACTASCLALRGTCFFILGLLSSTEQGREVLEENGWESPDDMNCLVSVPKDIRESPFLKVNIPSLPPAPLEIISPPWAKYAEGTPQYTLLSHIDLLVNPIRQAKALADLKALKTKTPDLFLDSKLYLAVLVRFGAMTSRLEVRRIVYELFATCSPATETLKLLNSVRPKKEDDKDAKEKGSFYSSPLPPPLFQSSQRPSSPR